MDNRLTIKEFCELQKIIVCVAKKMKSSNIDKLCREVDNIVQFYVSDDNLKELIKFMLSKNDTVVEITENWTIKEIMNLELKNVQVFIDFNGWYPANNSHKEIINQLLDGKKFKAII